MRKGTRHLLFKNRSHLKDKAQRNHLKELLNLNETLRQMMNLKEQRKRIWEYKTRTWTNKAIDPWCIRSHSVGQPLLDSSAKQMGDQEKNIRFQRVTLLYAENSAFFLHLIGRQTKFSNLEKVRNDGSTSIFPPEPNKPRKSCGKE